METGLVFVLLYWLVLVSARVTYPVGISLGPEYITAAYFTMLNEHRPVLITRIPGNAQYVEYMKGSSNTIAIIEKERVWIDGQWMTWEEGSVELVPEPPFYYNTRKALGVFRAVFAAAKKRFKATPGNPFIVGAVSHPAYFNNSCKHSVADSLHLFEPSYEEDELPMRTIGLFDAACLAYGLNSCEGLGLNNTECTSNGLARPRSVVLVDYNKDSLSFIHGNVETLNSTEADHYVRIDQLESKEPLLTESNGDWHHRTVYQRSLAPAEDRYSQFVEAFQDFIKFNFMGEDDVTFSCEKLATVIFSGEVPSDEMDRMRSIVKAVLPPTHHHKLKDYLDPAYVAAIGAAYHARELVRNPIELLPDHEEL